MSSAIIAGELPASPFNDYLGELLRSEGLRLPTHSISELSQLGSPSTVLLPPVTTSRAGAQAIATAVSGGAELVVIRPSLLLRETLGLRTDNTTLRGGYLRASGRIGGLFAQDAVQLPVVTDHYPAGLLPPGTEVVAQRYAELGDRAGEPAVFRVPVGQGAVVVFSYDLAHAVALLRQGDPAQTDSRSLGGNDPYRPTDLLAGFIDERTWHVPQADLHVSLLSNAIAATPAAPARVWHYPDAALGTVVVQDSDDDWSTQEQFAELISEAEKAGASVSFYLMAGTRPTVLTPDQVADLRSRGHSFGIHHNAFDESFAGEEQALVVERALANDHAWFTSTFGGTVLVNRNHCLIWDGYADMARLHARHGVLMDLNYENSPRAWLKYMAGSGRPVRFVDRDGSIIDVFQQATHVFDDSLVQELLGTDPATEVARFGAFLDQNAERFSIPTVLQSHPVSFATYSRDFFVGCWRIARERGIPIWSAEQWAIWTSARDAIGITEAETPDGRVVTVTGMPGADVAVAVGERFRPVSPGDRATPRAIAGIAHQIVQLSLGPDGTSTLILERSGS